MADTKLTGLTEETTPASTDLSYIVIDPGSSPASRKCTLANLGTGIIEGLTTYEVDALPIGWAIDGTVAPGALSTLSSTNSAKYRDFSGSADNDVFLEWQVPYGIIVASGITFQVEGWITSATGPANTETVSFILNGASLGDSDILSSTLGTPITVTRTFLTLDPLPVQYDRFITWYSTTVTITNLLGGELVILNLKRETDDTYAQSIGVGWLKIKYARNIQGS